MHKNMNSPSKLTEFAPLSPEESQPVVASLFSKFFGFSKSSVTPESSVTSPNNDEKSSSGESESWKRLESIEKTPEDETRSMINFPLDASEGRSLPNVLKRISNIVASKSNNLQSYKDSQLRSYWMPDSVSKQCYECSERFTTFRRRHHCRVCGQIFCSKCCCDEIPGKIMNCTGDLRVCTYCCKVVLSYLQSSDMKSDLSADLRALQEDLQEKYGNDSFPIEKSMSNTVECETLVRRKPSVGYMEEKYAAGRQSNTYLTSHERMLVLQNSASLRMIFEELFHSSQAILLQTHRIRLKSYYNCFLGNELVNWMIAQNKAATRIQATSIGQALLEAGFIESVLLDSNFSDAPVIFKPAKLTQMHSRDFLMESQTTYEAQEPAWVKTIPQHDSATDSENESKQPPQLGRMPSSSSSFYLDLNVEASTATLKRPSSEETVITPTSSSALALVSPSMDCNDGNLNSDKVNEINSKVSEDLLEDTLQVQEIKEKDSWHKVANLRNTFGEKSTYNQLTTAYKQHEDGLLHQLLSKEGLSQNWSETILQIAHQIVDCVRPDLYHDADDIDVRQYVQIKKSPGSTKNDCEIVSGVVCSKNVAHRGMNAMIANPKILLIRCALLYQRVEGKLLSLEPVMMQENEYLGHTVARITALGPDIVLVHRSVSRLAQDRLRECGVTLVLNVKLNVLERIARCTGANIIDTIDAHISARYRLGTCKKFYLRNFPCERTGVKTLMYFEGCANPHLGATVLLRGGSENELKRVKNVTQMMIFAAYSCRLEKSFLMDEFARPPSPKDNSFFDESGRNDSPSKNESFVLHQGDDDEVMVRVKRDRYYSDSSIPRDEKCNDDSTIRRKISSESSEFTNLEETNEKPDKLVKTSAILTDNTNVYDTLKLFKTKRKSSHESSEQLCTEFDRGEHQIKEKVLAEEKRTYGESVSDWSDPLHQYMNNDENDADVEVFFNTSSPNNGQQLSVADLPLLNKFKKALEGTILSVSPYLKFTIPYLETEQGRNCVLRSFFPSDVFYSLHLSDKIEGARANNTSTDPLASEHPTQNIRMKPCHGFVNAKLTWSADSREVQAMVADYRACGSRLYPLNSCSLKSITPTQVENQNEPVNEQTPAINRKWPDAKQPDCLDPASHQRLSVLFCSFRSNLNLNGSGSASAFCVHPWVVNMDLYGRNDIALGRFLERYCLTTDYKCPAKSCRAQIDHHVRRFVHDGGCVHISLNEMTQDIFQVGSQKQDRILMWSKCTKCKSVSPVVPISDDTWSLSFAKYLELQFHGGVYTRRDVDTCQHSLHQEHQHHFLKKNMLAIFRYSKISQWEISMPPPLIKIIYDPKQHSNVIEEMKMLALKGDEVFSSIRDKFSSLQIDSDALASMKQQIAKEQQYFKTKIEEVQLKLTSPTLESKKLEGKHSEKHVQSLMHRIEDGVVILKRLIAEAVYTWNGRISEAMAAAKKKDEKVRKFPDRSSISNNVGGGLLIENDGYITEDTASESQIEDLSPMSADYNAVDAIAAIGVAPGDLQSVDTLESSDNEFPDPANPDDIIVIQGSPKTYPQGSSYSDNAATPPNFDDAPDKRKKKKTILSQLLPSAAAANPIQNPLGPTEHYLLPLGSVVPIVIYECEPSSIIAYALDSHDYKHALQEQLRSAKVTEQNQSPSVKRKMPESKEIPNNSEILSSGELKRPSVLSFLRGNSPNPASPLEDKNVLPTDSSGQTANVNVSDMDEDKRASKQFNQLGQQQQQQHPQQQHYIEVQFNDSTTNFYCRIYFAAQFAALRENVLPCGEDGYTRSLSRSIQWAARGGKSGTAFRKTRDDRFVLKEMTRMDMQIFMEFAPNYFKYMEKCQKSKQPTLLGKIVGVYRISFKNNTTNSELRISVLVMENLFYNRVITDKFDLKGSVRNRLVNPEDDHEGELVLLDENLLNMSCDSPLYIRPHAKSVLNKAIEEDTKFLADNCVMDYSLLVGLEPNSDELVLGIIDYLRTFTWDKKLETMVKKSGILGGQGKLPTIVSPVEYRSRFIAAMHRYFLLVPDRWTGLGLGVVAP